MSFCKKLTTYSYVHCPGILLPQEYYAGVNLYITRVYLLIHSPFLEGGYEGGLQSTSLLYKLNSHSVTLMKITRAYNPYSPEYRLIARDGQDKITILV